MTKNKSHKKKSLGWYLDLALNLILLFFGLVLVWILLQVTCIATFKIPSDSMLWTIRKQTYPACRG